MPLAATALSATAADPASAVPAVAYRSVFVDTPKGVETESLDWRAANAEVGQFVRGHIDILKWEAAQTGVPAGSQPPAAVAPSTPGAAKP